MLAAVAYPSPRTARTSRPRPCVVAVLASLMVSYTRARAEALGVECKVGIGSRAVRVVDPLGRPAVRRRPRARRLLAARGQPSGCSRRWESSPSSSASCTFARQLNAAGTVVDDL